MDGKESTRMKRDEKNEKKTGDRTRGRGRVFRENHRRGFVQGDSLPRMRRFAQDFVKDSRQDQETIVSKFLLARGISQS
jgi:hypothetical protein